LICAGGGPRAAPEAPTGSLTPPHEASRPLEPVTIWEPITPSPTGIGVKGRRPGPGLNKKDAAPNPHLSGWGGGQLGVSVAA